MACWALSLPRNVASWLCPIQWHVNCVVGWIFGAIDSGESGSGKGIWTFLWLKNHQQWHWWDNPPSAAGNWRGLHPATVGSNHLGLLGGNVCSAVSAVNGIWQAVRDAAVPHGCHGKWLLMFQHWSCLSSRRLPAAEDIECIAKQPLASVLKLLPETVLVLSTKLSGSFLVLCFDWFHEPVFLYSTQITLLCLSLVFLLSKVLVWMIQKRSDSTDSNCN